MLFRSNRTRRDLSGRTAHYRWKGRDFKREIAEFGERVFYLKLDSAGKNKYDVRWNEGIFLGVMDESNEILVGTREGVVKAKDFKRMGTYANRWNKQEILEMKGAPWEPTPGRGGDMEVRPRINVEEDVGPTASPPVEPKEVGAPKRGRIYRDEAFRFGLDFNCLGRRAINTGAKAQGHREECRKRIEEELRKEGKQERFDRKQRE